MKISVVIPVYGCPEAIPELHRRLKETLLKITESYEIILVDDCCPKGSWIEIEKICNIDSNVVGIHLSRNFGQTKALTAGLDACSGDLVVVMDCDLQDRPEEIITLYEKQKEGFDIVLGRRIGRKDSFITKFFSRLFYKVYNSLCDYPFDPMACNFSIATKQVVDNYCSMREQNRDYTLFLSWLGFEQAYVDLPADPRFAGKSSYTFSKKLKLATDLITAQSEKPLRIATKLGMLMAFCSFLFILFVVIRYLVWPTEENVIGWTSIIASIFLVGGILVSFIGIAGIYIGNIFNETKNRPLYIVAKTINSDSEK